MAPAGLCRYPVSVTVSCYLIIGGILQLLLTTDLTMASPVPQRNDIISGQDFLSLFIAESPPVESSADHRSLAHTRNAPVEGDIGNDIIPSPVRSGERSLKPPTDKLVTPSAPQQRSTTTNATKSPNGRAAITTRSAKQRTQTSASTNKRIIVRKLVNVHGRLRNSTLPDPATKSSKSSLSVSHETNYLDETVHRQPINSHRSESLFIEEADARDLVRSESMNVPRIVKLPVTTAAMTGSSPLPPSSSSSSSTSSSSTVLRAAAAGGGSMANKNSENDQRNLPFTLHRVTVSSNRGTGAAEEERQEEDLVSNASRNDQLVQEQRMVTSRSRSQQPNDLSSPAPPTTAAAYQTVVYGSIGDQQQPAVASPSPVRVPVARSIAYSRREQKLSVSPPSGPLYQAKVYSEPAKVYSEPAKIYSEPAKVYSEPAKVYSQPEKVYSEPAKFYSEPAKVYSEPAKFYSEPAKVYSEPAKNYGVPPTPFPTTTSISTTTPRVPSSTTLPNRKILSNLDKLPYDLLNAPNRNLDLTSTTQITQEWNPPAQQQQKQLASGGGQMEHLFYGAKTPEVQLQEEEGEPEGEGELEEGAPPSATKSGDNNKTGYVVEGRTYRKYRVEEKTPDGFIVGEYGVVSHNDGNLRGVRYTADSNINPRLIYDALLKFLSL